MGININGNLLTNSFENSYGIGIKNRFRRVTPEMIDSVETPNFVVNSSGADSNGFYYIDGYTTVGGCGGAEGGVWVKIKNTEPWSYLFCTFTLTSTAACWGFNGGGYGGMTDTSGNMTCYSEGSGDWYFSDLCTDTFENSQYTRGCSACDNEVTNFMRYGTTKVLTVLSRRNNLSNLAGPKFGRSCTGTGSGAGTKISNIIIF